MLHKFYSEQKGGIVLEAALILPFFLAFVVGLVICIQIACLEMALQAGVSEATKSIAGQLYPVRLLVQEAKVKFEQSGPVEIINSAIGHVQSAREQVSNTENLADEYAAYIPQPLLELVKWEKEKRLQGEELLTEGKDELFEQQVKSRLHAAFTPIVYAFCDDSIVQKTNFKVVSVTLPSLYNDGDAYFGIEAEISYRLPIPFLSQTIILKKRAFERAW
ncbi:pilus assembly protein [Paenibacillus sp. CGMCC 1.16610]|uniref:Pilus assembly protein n=1 Tax=Paenibacillus anseongense TaxID=2682845 RepID=A0ABW9UHR5_9BACL|nr:MULTISPECIES: pilus assembly protein [Paenibacillus]MBA2940071.1 pilus assembly protein [Paenibacillus sp. CGMCC 1.16610]MVQ39026.1 pilus assembly protein [Paenibacillus anseongense]